MQIDTNTPRTEGTIEGLSVSFPAPYAEGQPLTAATAAILNQTLKENISNNVRSKIKLGHVATEGADAVPHTAETAQSLIDSYVESYEPGVRRGGGGEPRVTDPVEKEARAIARDKAKELVISKGGKPKDYDMADIASKIFDAHREPLMAAAKKIVDARNKQAKATDEFGLDSIELTAKQVEATVEGATA